MRALAFYSSGETGLVRLQRNKAFLYATALQLVYMLMLSYAFSSLLIGSCAFTNGCTQGCDVFVSGPGSGGIAQGCDVFVFFHFPLSQVPLEPILGPIGLTPFQCPQFGIEL